MQQSTCNPSPRRSQQGTAGAMRLLAMRARSGRRRRAIRTFRITLHCKCSRTHTLTHLPLLRFQADRDRFRHTVAKQTLPLVVQHVAWHGCQSRSIARLHSADSSRPHQSHRKLSSEQQASVERLTRRPSVGDEAAELKEQGCASEITWTPPSASEFAQWVAAAAPAASRKVIDVDAGASGGGT